MLYDFISYLGLSVVLKPILAALAPLSSTRGPFLESPGNLPGPVSVFGDKCFLTEVNFC